MSRRQDSVPAPPGLKNIVVSALTEYGVEAPPTGVPWQQQVQVLEKRKKGELECFLKTALLKLSPCEDTHGEAFAEAAALEMEALRELLVHDAP